MALFAEFFSPYPLEGVNLKDTFIAPSIVRLMDADGKFHLRPFVYAQEVTLDPKTFEPTWTENPDKMYPHQFLRQGLRV